MTCDGERKQFSSLILPGYARRSPKVTEVLPILYLHGLSTGDFAQALRELLGSAYEAALKGARFARSLQR